MYYILYEGLKIESNEPVYCTMYIVHCTSNRALSSTRLKSLHHVYLSTVITPHLPYNHYTTLTLQSLHHIYPVIIT